MPFKCQGHPVSLWRWPLTCNLEKCFSLRSSFGMYDLKRRLRHLHLLSRHCPCNLLPEPTSLLIMNIEGNFEATLWRHRWCHHHGKKWHNLGCFFFISEVKLKLCLILQNFHNGRHFELETNFFYGKWYRKLNISEGWLLAFPTFLSFWSTL